MKRNATVVPFPDHCIVNAAETVRFVLTINFWTLVQTQLQHCTFIPGCI